MIEKLTITWSNIAEFGSITQKPRYIEIGEQIGNEGGFGIAYRCLSIDGIPPQQDMVVKLLFKNNLQQEISARLGIETIKKLQNRLSEKQHEKRISLFEQYPALRGIPTCCFEGRKTNNEIVKGHISLNLVSLGMMDFKDFMSSNDNLDALLRMPMDNRLLLSLQLVKAFELLQDINFVHADLKEEAIFLGIEKGDIALIDFDSGTVAEDASDDTTTEGTPTSTWLAPEVINQGLNNCRRTLKGEKELPILVNKYSDRWSIMIAINTMLTSLHPLEFIDGGTLPLKTYLNSHKWPEISDSLTKEKFFSKNYIVSQHEQVKNMFRTYMPSEVYDLIKETIDNAGIYPARRKSFDVWARVIENNISSQYQNTQLGKKNKKRKAKKNTTMAAIITAIIVVLIVGAFSFPHLKKDTSDDINVENVLPQLHQELIEGYYSVKWKQNGEQIGDLQRAEIKVNAQKEYQLSIINDFGIKDYPLIIDGSNVSSPHFGSGQIDYNEKHQRIKIVFTSDNDQVWELIKRLE